MWLGDGTAHFCFMDSWESLPAASGEFRESQWSHQHLEVQAAQEDPKDNENEGFRQTQITAKESQNEMDCLFLSHLLNVCLLTKTLLVLNM